MNKGVAISGLSGYVSSLKKDDINSFGGKMDEMWGGCAKWKKSGNER